VENIVGLFTGDLMVDAKCTRCGNSKAHPRTFFGFRVGPLCTPCAVESHQKWKLKINPLIREMRESMEEHFRKIETETGAKVESVDVPTLLESRCQKCNDLLTGHEDERGRTCRWCGTCTEVTEGESIAALKS
jgi:hypothetical protein